MILEISEIESDIYIITFCPANVNNFPKKFHMKPFVVFCYRIVTR